MVSSPLRLLCVAGLALASMLSAYAVPEPFRLYKISVRRFVVDDVGNRLAQRGLLDSLGRFELQTSDPVPEGVSVPAEVLNRTVITLENWSAYGHLGSMAVANFAVDEMNGPFLIGQRYYQYVTPAASPRLDLGDAVNLSTRSRITPDGEPLIGGFVIENQHRWVLIRGVGPGLAALGVTEPVADPHIVIYKNGSQQFQFFNDDWGQRFDADAIEQTAARVGAFPLARGSKDAAYLIELAPGAYTVHLSTDGPAGTGLLEVYVVPTS